MPSEQPGTEPVNWPELQRRAWAWRELWIRAEHRFIAKMRATVRTRNEGRLRGEGFRPSVADELVELDYLAAQCARRAELAALRWRELHRRESAEALRQQAELDAWRFGGAK